MLLTFVTFHRQPEVVSILAKSKMVEGKAISSLSPAESHTTVTLDTSLSAGPTGIASQWANGADYYHRVDVSTLEIKLFLTEIIFATITLAN